MKSECLNPWPVDSHVHLHELDLVAPILDAAASSFRSVNRDARASGALLLAQAAPERVFEQLQALDHIAGWRIHGSREEPVTLIAERDDAKLAIVCGRQLRADDGLEVLALGTCKTFDDGMTFEDSVEAVRRTDALVVLPWGVGKWLGRRGARVRAALQSHGVDEVFVGDNGGRLGLLGEPATLRSFRGLGFRVLPGTDPFPLRRDLPRVGRFGFLADLIPSESAPWRDLRRWLLGQRESPRAYGRALDPFAFFYNQVGLRVRNRRASRAAAPA